MIFMEIINFKIDNNVNKYLKVLYFFFIVQNLYFK